MALVEGRAYRIPGKPEIYLYTSYGGRLVLRHIPDLETFEAMGRPTVFEIDQATFDATPKGPPLPSVIPPTLYTWVRGLVTANDGIPSIGEVRALNFNVVMPFGWDGNQAALKNLASNGIKIIPNSSQMGGEASPALEQEYNIMAYFITDEPEFNFEPQDIINRVNGLRARTNLPITCNFTAHFWMNEPWMKGRWGDHYPEVFAVLDFVCFDSYFYRVGGLYQTELNYAKEAIKRIKAEGKSIIGLTQGHESARFDITRPDIVWTDNFWRSNGCGVLWFVWNGYDISVGNRGGENEWYNQEIAKVSGGQWPPEVITPHIITCSKCGSQLKLSVSSIANKNTEQFCPICGEAAD